MSISAAAAEPVTAERAVPAGTYNDKVVRQFAVMTVVWGIVGMSVGVIIAAQLYWPELNFGISWLSYGRLRPLHTNAVIFAFGGSALFATSYYVVQRTCHVRLFAETLAAFTFWGWQAVIVLAAITLPAGMTTRQGVRRARVAHRCADRRWCGCRTPIVFLGTLVKRRVSHIYVANWFFASFIITVAVLHIVNSAEVPVSLGKSYSIYAGTVDAMVQWWYGHNAVGFFLTAGFLGMMYYFVPKQAGRPVYSYRLSIVHFWALISIYMWAGPHHLHYTTLPDWAQSLGMVFSLILLGAVLGRHDQRPHDALGRVAQVAHRSDPQVHGGGAVVLRHADVRRADDVHQDSQLAVALHGLDGRARARRRARLGGDDHRRLHLLDAAAPLRQEGDVQHQAHRLAFLDHHHWRGAVHRVDVDRRRDAGPDVARHERRRLAHVLVHRGAECHLSVLRGAPAGRRDGARRHVPHGLQLLEDRRRAARA